MENNKEIRSALISVYNKEYLERVVKLLNELGITIYSTGGTFNHINQLGIEATPVESLTSYPSILGGRVKTLHPKVFGGILARRFNTEDAGDMSKYEIPSIDLVIVDLYPFEDTVKAGVSHDEIIENIDIGGISLIRAAAKNYNDVLVVPSAYYFEELIQLLESKRGATDLADRKRFAVLAYELTSHYDTMIFEYIKADEPVRTFKQSIPHPRVLRYGENPHQEGTYYGKLDEVFEQIHGKAISYNNLVDIDAAIGLISEFEEPTFVVMKHTNACGVASRPKLVDAWKDALAGDPVSAFGGVLICNSTVDEETANEIDKIFFEVILAPAYEDGALEKLRTKKNRIILVSKSFDFGKNQFKSLLNGVIEQSKDEHMENPNDWTNTTTEKPDEQEAEDLVFANKIVKHFKSNAIALAKNKQLVAGGIGQTSRVDALKQAITKAKTFEFDLKGAVMASDAFFPFSDSVELANKEGINAVIQPGGSKRDQESIDYCNEHSMRMVFTGFRHFKH
ncbi:MAG: bifunctional phosphoribosylaminoimidazolecarboxamide formyltransferase/IMP cyclohydrolase [Bacteroidales bacterium]|nr:bifunctional phosphoribosylaminoimidazolecarboxamide formyltransferase/IMP cyclohydrolase [Bacteroidales bacterium]